LLLDITANQNILPKKQILDRAILMNMIAIFCALEQFLGGLLVANAQFLAQEGACQN